MKLILIVFSALLTSTSYAGGIRDSVNLSLAEPSPIPGEVIVPVAQNRWSDNCIPVSYNLNTSKDPIPDPNGGPGLPLSEAKAAIQQALTTWTDIPTSYIDMQLSGTTDNPGFAKYDFVNEVTFTLDPILMDLVGQEVIAFSGSTTLLLDTTLTAGQDVDMDGDSDVSATITTCGDTDGDGDVEFPAGFYPAGTIIDNDLQFNTIATSL